jgi:hypothetical protein
MNRSLYANASYVIFLVSFEYRRKGALVDFIKAVPETSVKMAFTYWLVYV